MLLALVLFWIVCSGKFELFYVVIGIVSVALTIYIDKRVYSKQILLFGFKVTWFIFLLEIIKDVFKSSIAVTKIIWSRNLNLSPEFRKVNCKNLKEAEKVALANFITLTPGTMSVSVSDNDILVHALNSEFFIDLENEKTVNKVRRINC